MSEYVQSQVVDKVATIKLNRPEKLNAFTDDMITSWVGLLEEYRTSADVNVIVITGTGRAFTTGGDVASSMPTHPTPPQASRPGSPRTSSGSRSKCRRSTNP